MTRAFLGFGSGVGLVAANMIGAGVFLSAGYMAQDLGPVEIVGSWVVGAVIALLGAVAYADLAVRSGRSGGEYRYLSDLAHPFLGRLAGWASLLVGFAAPVAINAYAAAAFLHRIAPMATPKLVGTVLIVVFAAVHAARLRESREVQNGLVALKVAFVAGFVAVGLGWGAHAWPTWSPPNASDGFPWAAFADNQYWVAFAFSGWNAAIYTAAEFGEPRRDVPRALVVGCLLVAVLYVLLNAVFVANLEPHEAFAVASDESGRATLAHPVMEAIAGPAGATVSSALAIVVFASTTSAMMLAGPRVVAAMADDGVLPAALGSREGRPPSGAVWLQAVLALVLLHAGTLLDSVKSTSAVLMAMSAATALLVLLQRPVPLVAGLAAVLYAAAVAAILAVGLATTPAMVVTLAVVVAATLITRTRPPAPTDPA